MRSLRIAVLPAAMYVIAVSAQSMAITIVLTGQSMLRSDLRITKPAAVPAIKGLLNGDVVFTNLEATIALPGETISEGRGFLTPPEALDALTAIGFNLLAVANNHAFDLKETGIRNTISELDRRHIVHAGTGVNITSAAAPAYLRTPKGTIALVASASGLISAGGGATPAQAGVNELRVEAGDRKNNATEDLPVAVANTVNPEDSQRILQSIRDERQHADLVIVYQHNHVFGNRSFSTIFTEGLPERLAPNPWLTKWTHDEIDAGADVVVMHGAPLLHGVEVYRGRPIFYDLGNFIYNLPPTLTYIDEPMAWESVVAIIQFDTAPARESSQPALQKLPKSISFRPVVLNDIGEGQPDVHNAYTSNQFLHTRGLPAAATAARAGYILQRLADASKTFGTTMEIARDTATLVLTNR